MIRTHRSLAVALAGLFGLLLCWRIQAAAAGPPSAPSNCIEHTGLVPGEPDFAGDMRCAGLAIEFHTGGVARSPKPIWAGQWLLLDETGTLRIGTCVFNRGIHPTIDRPSVPVTQPLPMDPTGAKSAYLMWRYGTTTDDLTAAAVWAVAHYYAQDAAGSNRSADPAAPLVPSLAMVAEMSGRQDLEDAALALDGEAARLTEPFALTVSIDADGHGVVQLRAGSVPVSAAVSVQVSGAAFDDDTTRVQLATAADGAAVFEVAGPGQAIEVVAEATGPGPAQVYRAAPADPVGHLPQTLLTAGPPATLRAVANVTLAAPTTTTTEPPTTTTEAPTTTTEAPTTTIEATTTTTEATTTTTEATTTTELTTTTTTELPATTTTTTTPATTTTTTATTIVELPPLPVIPAATLPRTGSTGDGAAYLGTGALVAGIGVLGAIRRRMRPLA